ncbi:MAG TPA: hypothetical protein VET27_23325 [Mycobacterium sp.]|nr:hypothetical protein [Mycobacterium sp.]
MPATRSARITGVVSIADASVAPVAGTIAGTTLVALGIFAFTAPAISGLIRGGP